MNQSTTFHSTPEHSFDFSFDNTYISVDIIDSVCNEYNHKIHIWFNSTDPCITKRYDVFFYKDVIWTEHVMIDWLIDFLISKGGEIETLTRHLFKSEIRDRRLSKIINKQ